MKNLKKVLQELSEKEIEGVNRYARLAIVTNDRFSLEYNRDIKEFVLNTTNGNQVVDASFIDELNILNQAKELLNEEELYYETH